MPRADIAAPQGPADQFARPLRDLRISVTDRCNFRCPYCMPKTVFGRDYPFLARSEVLSFEEIERVARAAVANGVRKIRLTGGEPLLRKKLENLIERLAQLPVELTLTTNGVLLAKQAASLRAAGLQRVTISLDALNDATFRAMNDADFGVADVLAGIDAAAEAGLQPIKINCVVKRGSNEQEILPLARRFRGSGHTLRFIEYMDVGATNGWNLRDVVTAREIRDTIAKEYPVQALDHAYPGEVAERWAYQDGMGEIGLIASVTQAFCRDCTRLRLSTDGKLYTCLFASSGLDLRQLLRSGDSDENGDKNDDEKTLSDHIRQLWLARRDRYSELRQTLTPRVQKIEMHYIGG